MFLHHPDGFVTIGELRYALAEFLIDEPSYALPDGMIGRVYEPDVQHWLTDGQMQHPGPLPWAQGDAYLAKEADYRAAFGERTALPAPTLDEIKARARRVIDQQAEQRRLVYITPGAGQAMVYMEKRREAEAALEALANAGGNPVDPAEFPLLAAELGVTGSDLQDVAETILASAKSWALAAAAIEGVRLKAKHDIDAAAAAEEVDALLNALAWGV